MQRDIYWFSKKTRGNKIFQLNTREVSSASFSSRFETKKSMNFRKTRNILGVCLDDKLSVSTSINSITSLLEKSRIVSRLRQHSKNGAFERCRTKQAKYTIWQVDLRLHQSPSTWLAAEVQKNFSDSFCFEKRDSIGVFREVSDSNWSWSVYKLFKFVLP